MTSDELMPPNLKVILDEVKAEIFATLNCCQIAKIESVDTSAQTVEATIQIKRLAADGTSTTYPTLVDLPYFVLQGGGAYIDMPIAAGDYCIILFNDRNIDDWWSTANVADPPTKRKHSLSDGIAIVGINPSSAPLGSNGPRLVGASGAGTEKAAARTDDEVQSTATEDSTFWAWLTSFVAIITANPYATLQSAMVTFIASNPVPTSLTGKITGGSSDWSIT